VEENKGMQTGFRYFGNALKVTLGAGAALGGAYLLSRVGEKQDTEASLGRLEQMLAELAETEAVNKVANKKRK
jgi:hypothetical protein